MALIGAVARTAAVAGTATAVSNRVSARQAGRWAAQNQPPPQNLAPPPRNTYLPPMRGRYRAAMFQPGYGRPAPQPVAQPVQPQATPPAPVPTPDEQMNARLARLQQLGALRAQGVLSAAEFEAQKQQILADA